MRMRSSSLIGRFVTGSLTPVLLAALGGCGPAPAPENPTQPAPSAPSAPASSLPPRSPSRALPPSQAASFLGGIEGKRLYLVGGERWLIDDAGRLDRSACQSGPPRGRAVRALGRRDDGGLSGG